MKISAKKKVFKVKLHLLYKYIYIAFDHGVNVWETEISGPWLVSLLIVTYLCLPHRGAIILDYQ